jgi:hypothetical protein
VELEPLVKSETSEMLCVHVQKAKQETLLSAAVSLKCFSSNHNIGIDNLLKFFQLKPLVAVMMSVGLIQSV